MCEPTTIAMIGAAVLGAASADDASRKAGHAREDMARESAAANEARAASDARAIQSANAKLAMDQRRRREQQSLLARGGAPQPTLGDQDATEPGASAFATTRNTAMRASLLTRGGLSRSGSYGSGRVSTPGRPSRESAI